jgi:hypothetical protein
MGRRECDLQRIVRASFSPFHQAGRRRREGNASNRTKQWRIRRHDLLERLDGAPRAAIQLQLGGASPATEFFCGKRSTSRDPSSPRIERQTTNPGAGARILSGAPLRYKAGNAKTRRFRARSNNERAQKYARGAHDANSFLVHLDALGECVEVVAAVAAAVGGGPAWRTSCVPAV